jgi:N-acylneuraminate cytidylyltransferase
MIDGKRVIGVIIARGGSKRVPGKNVRAVKGKPLIAWTIEAAKRSKHIDRLVVSTDDQGILEVAQEWGCEAPGMRPDELSQDDTAGVDPVLYTLKQLPGYDVVVLLQPTSPLRTPEDIDGCLARCVELRVSACVSVTALDKSPDWMYYVDEEGRMEPIGGHGGPSAMANQPRTGYVLNGAVYVAATDWLERMRTFLTAETAAYVMPQSRSLDIDTELDFKLLDAMIESGQE